MSTDGGAERASGETAYFGVDIGGTKTAVTAWNAKGERLDKLRFPTQGDYHQVLAEVVSAMERLTEGSGSDSLKAIGVSCGGPLDSRTGVVLSPPNLPGWDEVPVAWLLGSRWGVPCYLENDANACALAEWYWGAGRGRRNLVFLTFGTGLGAGLILDGRLYRGTNDLAGEVGHLRMAEDGPEGYGKRGSWEGFCSGGGLSRLYGGETGRQATAKEVCSLATQGDPAALRVIQESADCLGRGLAILLDLLNPELIIIGSVFARDEALFRPAMEAAIAREALHSTRQICAIVPAQLGEDLGDRAALGVAIDGLRREGKAGPGSTEREGEQP